MRTFRIAIVFGIFWSVCFGSRLLALNEPSYGHAEPFKDGDTVCFVGDSITHGGTYHSIIALFYATRFPGRTTHYYNCGVGGDQAAGIVGDRAYRVNVDILGHHPTVAMIMLGMNDFGRTYWAADKVGPQADKDRQNLMDRYNQKMTQLIEVLQQSGARLILITPSPYDDHVQLPQPADPKLAVSAGANAGLGRFAERVREMAEEHHAGLVEFHDTMNAVNAQKQQHDPAFTL